MAKGVYVGFSTQQVYQYGTSTTVGSGSGTGNIVSPSTTNQKFRTLDAPLVIQDLINALSIQQGSLPGLPQYGTSLWSFVFENADPQTLQNIQNEVTRVIGLDPRVVLNTITAFFQENGILIQCEISITPFNTAVQTGFFLNRNNGQVTQV